jgi:hypothetical protein
LIPIETLAPSPQVELVEAIWTFQAPSKLAAAAGVVRGPAASNRIRAAMNILRRLGMTSPFVSMRIKSHIGISGTVRAVTPAIVSGNHWTLAGGVETGIVGHRLAALAGARAPN